MEKALKIVNILVEKGIIAGYAIGGGVAASYYGESTMTYDLDLFVYFKDADKAILSLSSIYDFLVTLGYQPAHEGILIEGVDVQFLPPYNDLIIEAARESQSIIYQGVPTNILKLEYLIAIIVQTFRPKDQVRVLNLLSMEEDLKVEINRDLLFSILDRYQLKDKWNELARK